jgi:3-oxoacyl-[acyl-carrier protein] reductase
MKRFADRKVLVTGGSRGLGEAIARAFAAEGAFVHVGYAARRAEAERVAEQISGAAVAIDVRDATSIERALVGTGTLDVAVNNAAIADDAPFSMMNEKQFTDVVDVGLNGVFRVMRAVARPMMAKRAGAIVNVVSIVGPRASPGQANYAAAKSGVIGLTQTAAAELGPFGVRVNAVAPGLLTTGMAARLDKKIVEERRTRIPLRRLGHAEEAAAAVLFLASDDASYVVGHTLFVDGGLGL